MDEDPLVLVAEDDDGIRDVLCQILKMEKIRAVFAANGEEAIVRARAERPSLVLLDINLPKINGIAVAHELQHIHGSNLPILVMTADGHAAQKSADACATAYLAKPFTLPQFLETLYTMLGASHG